MSRPIPRAQNGAALVIGLIMLVLITLMLITALNLSTTNFRAVGNMQYREEAIYAANKAIEQIVSSAFTSAPVAETVAVDLDNDGNTDYNVDIAEPQCISASIAANPPQSSIHLGPGMSLSSTWNTIWEIDATVNSTDNVGTAAARVHAGVRALLSNAQKEAVCP